MTIDDMKKLVEVVRDTGISELEVQWGENRVKIRGAATAVIDAAAYAVLPAQTPVASPPRVAPVSATAPAPPAKPAEDDNNEVVKSPIVGTYYDSPSPDAPSFVKVGDVVEPKQVLCIIESMKLMNEIEAEMAGTIVAKHVENGHPVEYGEALFTVRPK